MQVKFYDNAASYSKIHESTLAEFYNTLEDALVNGKPVVKFERQIAEYINARHCIAVGNATDALIIALMAMGIGEGDEVIVPCYSFVASASCIRLVGATPVFIDIEPETYCVDVDQITSKITAKTKAILPVHLFNQMSDMEAIIAIAKQYNLFVLEDSAECIGMTANNCHAGLWGDIGVLSFFPTKTLGAFGDAGMIMTQNEQLAQACKLLRNVGRDETGLCQRIGFNSRMDNLQAVLLNQKLQNLPQDILKREYWANLYTEKLRDLYPLVKTPIIKRRNYTTTNVWYVYQIQTQQRDQLVKFLSGKGIETEVYYPYPFHLQPCFTDLNYKRGDFPQAEAAAQVAVSLPFYPDLTEKIIDDVVSAIKLFYRG